MHPTMASELVKIKIRDEHEYAARQRLARAARRTDEGQVRGPHRRAVRTGVGRALIRLGRGIAGVPQGTGAPTPAA